MSAKDDRLIPAIKANQPYFAQKAYKHGSYTEQAHAAYELVETIYGRMIGRLKGRDGKPMMIRDTEELEELKAMIKQAEKAVNKAMRKYSKYKGQFLDADDKALKAKSRLLSGVQEEYNRIKERIEKSINYDLQLEEHDKEVALESVEDRIDSERSDLDTLKGLNQSLFKY
jgi:hypothetical protein